MGSSNMMPLPQATRRFIRLAYVHSDFALGKIPWEGVD
jgi:hypothetical protein